MSFIVRELRKAKADKHHIVNWLHERSPSGALAWLDAYDRLVARLQTHADTFAEAYENSDLDAEVKEALFKTRRGRVYRALFLIAGEEAFILRVRGPGQASVLEADLDVPDDSSA